MTNAKKPKNENYYRSIYDDYKPLVVFIASIYLTNKDYIDDVVQEVFLETYSHDGTIKDLKNYIGALAKNKAIAINKANGAASSESSMDDFLVSNLSGKESFASIVDELLAVLSSTEANILLLHLYGGYTFKEIAGKTQAKESTVKAKYFRALKKCRKEFLR